MKMDVCRVYTRLMLVTLLVFGAFQMSESFNWTKRPLNPTVVVEGVNSSRASLNWEFNPTRNYIVGIYRQKLDGTQQVQIASRTGTPTSESLFDLTDQSFRTKYEAKLPATLVLKDVKRNEEFVYRILVLNQETGTQELINEVTIDVVVPPEITKAPTREPRLNIGGKENLTCSASGDPTPNITWTKDGVPMNEFNVSGPVLQLVNVQIKDAGSYRCTASNGYGSDATNVSIVGINCPGSDCEAKKVGIKLRSEDWKSPYSNQASVEFNTLESKLLSAISNVYTKNPDKQLYRVDVVKFRTGSVVAVVELLFGKSVANPLKPLEDEMSDENLGSFTVDRTLDLDPTDPPPTVTSTSSTTVGTEGADAGARGVSSGLTPTEMWGIIGGCIAFVLLIAIIILICCICKKKKSGGASKGGKSYSEADGYRMNRQPPPSGLGTASPAYVEARQYAPVTAARKQDDQSKPPLNYADLSFDNSSAPGKQPPRYSGTEYSEMSPEKRPPPAGGQQGEGGGFELWC